MCGICGWLLPRADGASLRAVERMNELLAHRGPDDHGVERIRSGSANLVLGNRRLAIRDRSERGHQPMLHPDGHALVYNGELYNADRLKLELEAEGIRFRGKSDTEILLNALVRWGPEALPRLRGMFAFAFWDVRARALLLARDPLGIKPLYHTQPPQGGFAFASETRALVASGIATVKVDREAVAGFLAYGSVQEPLTIWNGIRMLPAGTWIRVKTDGSIEGPHSYWVLPAARSEAGPVQQIKEEGRHLLSRAVKSHLVSDVPVGVFLSGGLDSAAVAALARREANVAAFTVVFPGDPDLNEGERARATATRLQVPLHECPVRAQDALAWLQEGLAAQDQPSMDGYNVYIVSRAVRRAGITVALSGQGGDELFGGYRSFSEVPRWKRGLAATRWLPAPVRSVAARARVSGRGSVARAKAGAIARLNPDTIGLYFQFRRLMSDEEIDSLGYEAERRSMPPNLQPGTPPEITNADADADADAVGRLELTYYLRNTLLRDSDVCGMANSLEIRVPLLDQDLVEWVFSLPAHVRYAGPGSKGLLRSMVPEADADSGEEKRGFVLPLDAWLRGPLKHLVPLAFDALVEAGLARREGLERVQRDFEQQPGTSAWSRLWALVCLGQWIRPWLQVGAEA